MQISGIQNPYNDVTSQPTKPGQSDGAFNGILGGTAENGMQQFMEYMKETPAQRMFDNSLNSQHITQSQFDAMPAKQQEALRQQFEQELKQHMTEALDKGPSVGSNKLSNLSSI